MMTTIAEAVASLRAQGPIRDEHDWGISKMTMACLMASGLESSEIPDDTNYLGNRHHFINRNLPARLTVVALGNAYIKPPDRIEQSADWEDFLEGHCEHQNPTMETWCDMVGYLMTDEEVDQWVEIADRHLAIARKAQDCEIPSCIKYTEHELDVAASTLLDSEDKYRQIHGENPSGHFIYTMLEAVRHVSHPEAE